MSWVPRGRTFRSLLSARVTVQRRLQHLDFKAENRPFSTTQRWSLALSASRGSLGNQCGVENIVDNLRRPRIRPILKDFGQCIWRIDGRILEHALHQKSSRLTHCWRRSDPEDSHDRVPIQRQRFGSKRWVLAQNVVNTL